MIKKIQTDMDIMKQSYPSIGDAILKINEIIDAHNASEERMDRIEEALLEVAYDIEWGNHLKQMQKINRILSAKPNDPA